VILINKEIRVDIDTMQHEEKLTKPIHDDLSYIFALDLNTHKNLNALLEISNDIHALQQKDVQAENGIKILTHKLKEIKTNPRQIEYYMDGNILVKMNPEILDQIKKSITDKRDELRRAQAAIRAQLERRFEILLEKLGYLYQVTKTYREMADESMEKLNKLDEKESGSITLTKEVKENGNITDTVEEKEKSG
jgi:hypothetical protein